MTVGHPPAMTAPPRRVRLKPWLLAQVESQRYPGLQWVDKRQRLFCIPWHHATRHLPPQEDDGTIFKAWAMETGKFTEGVDEPDPAKWKANLRCALNKSREFRLRYDGTKDAPPKPYKVYEVCEADGAEAVAGDDFSCGGEEDMSQLQKLTSLSIDAEPAAGGAPWEGSEVGASSAAPQPRCPPDAAVHAGDLLHPYPWPKEEPPFGSACPVGPFLPGGAVAAPELPPGAASTMPPPAALAPMEHGVPNLLISPHLLPLTDLELKFQYRGRQVCVLTISNPHGCRLFHSSLEPTQEQVELFGPLTLEQVRFPAADGIPNEKQRFYTHQLLDVLDRGLILELQGQDIYAIRLCQCKVFWSGPCAAHCAGPNPIEREKKTKLFSLEGFLNGLILFQKGQTTTPPPFEIFFCFGEEWPDQKPKEKKLITVQVVPVAARLLLEMFSGELSWSADSIPLQISHPDLKDRMVEQFKELYQLWQSQQRLPQPPARTEPGPWALPPGSLPQ